MERTEKSKAALVQTLTIRCPDFCKLFHVQLATTDLDLGTVLFQEHRNKMQITAFALRVLRSVGKNSSPY